MNMKIWSAIGVGALAAIGGLASCTVEGSGGTSSTEGTSSSTTAGSSSSGTGGAATTGTGGSGGSGQGGAGQGGSGGSGGLGGSGGSGGAGGSSVYQNCKQCTDAMSGAPMNECKAAHDACFAVKECVGIYNCAVMGTPPCGHTQAGGCCTLDCFTAIAAPQSAIDLYKAMDGCIACTVCRDLCATDEYCGVFEPGGDAVCTP